MKKNVDEKQPICVERTMPETLVERGRQLHDKAVFEMFARMFGFTRRAEPTVFQDSMHKTPGWVSPK